MKNVRYALLSSLLLLFALPAQALFVNFQQMGDGKGPALTGVAGSWGEAGYSPLVIPGVMSIRGYDGPNSTVPPTDEAFAYLDSANAGLGVCSVLGTLNNQPNQCVPSSDDNVSFDGSDNGVEYLIITFLSNTAVDSIVFNNNHDPDTRLGGDTITIDGVDKPFTDAAGSYDTDGGIITTFSSLSDGANANGNRDYLHDMAGKIFAKGSTLIISYFDGTGDPQARHGDEFYITSIGYDVPEPFTLALLGMGLLGFGALGRRQI